MTQQFIYWCRFYIWRYTAEKCFMTAGRFCWRNLSAMYNSVRAKFYDRTWCGRTGRQPVHSVTAEVIFKFITSLKKDTHTANILNSEQISDEFKASKTLGKHFSVSLSIKDLLNTSIRRSYNYDSGFNVDFDRYRYGTTFQTSIAYKLWWAGHLLYYPLYSC